ncbi:hypothetical protein [Vibrio salinus]|uniref:hypothetical protein n=1 Tax=Vibrio salinus TaxID=2899784 RepID=UPI001E45FE7B|nr:hypothetical protein [Vibrio salinus]MCE0493144.1 hypothetical protein [Vibrio salinus]
MKKKYIPFLLSILFLYGFPICATESSSDHFLTGREMRESNFFLNSKTKISLANKFQYLKSNDYPVENSVVQTAWAQGVRLDFESGYIGEHFGADISYAGVAKLAASDYFYTRQYLYASGDDMAPESFSKFEQAYLKQYFASDSSQLTLKEGQITLDGFGVLDGLNKVTNTSYRGALADLQYDKVEFRLGYFSQYMNADTPHNEHFATFSGNNYDYVLTGDLTYKDKNNSLRYLAGEYKDYLFTHGLEFKRHTGSIQYTAELYHNHALTLWKQMSDYHKTFDEDAYHFNMDLTRFSEQWVNVIGYSFTQANRKNGLGRFQQSLDNMTFHSQAYGLSEEFINDNESVLTLINIYKITPDYELGFVSRFGYGHHYQGNHMNDIELALFNKWTPRNIENLTLVLGLGPNWTFKRDYFNNPILDENGDWQRGSGFCVTSSIEYEF